MKTEVPFSSKRLFMTLMLCACAVILLQNHDLSADASFWVNLLSVFAGLAVCFLTFLPAIILKKKYHTDVMTLANQSATPLKWATAVFYALYFLFTAEYFLIPYTDMFCKKYYAGAPPCLIALAVLACCVYAAVKGVNVITRFGIFLFVLALVTNFLMFAGSASSLRFEENLAFRGTLSAFLQNSGYFITPCFIAAIYVCLSGYTRRFTWRQPLTALALTGLKYALVLFFIAFSAGEYAGRQEYETYLLSRVAHFGSFAGIESFYMALSTMSVFMITALLLCCTCRGFQLGGNVKWTAAFAALLFFVRFIAEKFDSLNELFTNAALLNGFTFVAAVVIPSVYLIGRKKHA